MSHTASVRDVVQRRPSHDGEKVVNSGTTTVTGLWPFPDSYSVWARRAVNRSGDHGMGSAPLQSPRTGRNQDSRVG